jgi:hypothetical protein
MTEIDTESGADPKKGALKAHPCSLLFPPMSEDEMQRLVANIKLRGLVSCVTYMWEKHPAGAQHMQDKAIATALAMIAAPMSASRKR